LTNKTLDPAKTCVWDTGAPGLSGSGCAAAGVATKKYKEGATPGLGFAGDFNLWLRAPGKGNSGAVGVTATVPSWLRYNWTGTVANPAARATFGIYKSPLIYRRENY
jgi:MSHA biogenesis protein MshQ